jgi:hypothetical protein
MKNKLIEIAVTTFVTLCALVLPIIVLFKRWNRARKINQGIIRLMANAGNQPGTGRNTSGIRTFLCGLPSDWTTFAAAYTDTYQPPGRFACVILYTDASNNQSIRISTSATDNIIGVCLDAPDTTNAAGGLEDPLQVILLNSSGTIFMVASGVIAAGAFVQSNGDGAVATWATSGAYCIGRTINASTAAGDILEVIPLVNSSTHA